MFFKSNIIQSPFDIGASNNILTMEDHGSLRSAIATMAVAAQWQRALLLAEAGDIFGGAMVGISRWLRLVSQQKTLRVLKENTTTPYIPSQ